jgi:hypothetical protein
MKQMSLMLTLTEVALLREILHFVDFGEVSGGPLEGIKHQQTTARIKTFRRLVDCADGAYAHFFAPPKSEGREQ